MTSLGTQLFVEPARAWNRFWFAPVRGIAIAPVRAAICIVTALWLWSFMGVDDLGLWFGERGLLDHSMSALLIEFEETPHWQHWSPLWWTSSLLAHQTWLVTGIVLSLLAAWGIGGRVLLAALLVITVGWIHRMTWLQGPMEPALVAMLGYLIVSPGKKLFSKEQNEPSVSWLNCMALRLIQTHCWILLAAGVLMQLGSLVWWRGEAVWWLAATGHSHLLSSEMLRNSPLFVNGLTHSMVAIELAALGLLVLPATRLWGMLTGLLAVLSVGMVADQFLYSLLLASCLLAWRYTEQTQATNVG